MLLPEPHETPGVCRHVLYRAQFIVFNETSNADDRLRGKIEKAARKNGRRLRGTRGFVA